MLSPLDKEVSIIFKRYFTNSGGPNLYGTVNCQYTRMNHLAAGIWERVQARSKSKRLWKGVRKTCWSLSHPKWMELFRGTQWEATHCSIWDKYTEIWTLQPCDATNKSIYAGGARKVTHCLLLQCQWSIFCASSFSPYRSLTLLFLWLPCVYIHVFIYFSLTLLQAMSLSLLLLLIDTLLTVFFKYAGRWNNIKAGIFNPEKPFCSAVS